MVLQNRSWELCHGMGHHTTLLAQFYHRPSKPLETPRKPQTTSQLKFPKVAQLCPLPPAPYAAAPPPTCPSHPSGQGEGRSCCHSVILSPFLSLLHDPNPASSVLISQRPKSNASNRRHVLPESTHLVTYCLTETLSSGR